MSTDYGSADNSSSLPKKRTLRVPDFLNEIAGDKSVYPKGIVGSLKESGYDSVKVERIELFAHQEEEKGKYYGILKQLFVAFSSESNLLKLAGASSNVIEVHGLGDKSIENGKAIRQSTLVLRRSEEEDKEQKEGIHTLYGEHTPNLFVSSHWLDLMSLSTGDRVIISNPRGEYEIPPPC